MSPPYVEVVRVVARDISWNDKDLVWPYLKAGQEWVDDYDVPPIKVYSGLNRVLQNDTQYMYVVVVWPSKAKYVEFKKPLEVSGEEEPGNDLWLLAPSREFRPDAALGAKWTTITIWSLKKSEDIANVTGTLIPQYVQHIHEVLPSSGAGWGFVDSGSKPNAKFQVVVIYGTEEGGQHWSPLHSPEHPGVYKVFEEMCRIANLDTVHWVELNPKWY
ncbi:hypothetical protein NM688_g6096 [Phlebia brevispora]|uniref:Uncharacterized protein n=1 Tax=Phlebia brevispora TaxID=194682 RepID=A0ACC1SK00_9APHY|nr:hypothetical protein NM688_g6096 [Phlebia brevispora]